MIRSPTNRWRDEDTHYIGDSEPIGANTVGTFVGLTASLQSEMANLEPNDRILLWGKYVEGKTYRQLSEELGVPRLTLQNRVTKLNLKLLDSLTVEVNSLTRKGYPKWETVEIHQ